MNASFRKINRSYSKGRLANTLKIESPISNFSRENTLDSDSFFQIFSDKFVTQGGKERRLISEFMGRDRHCRVIITTRNPLRIAAEDKESGRQRPLNTPGN